jgi:hypothetical protein
MSQERWDLYSVVNQLRVSANDLERMEVHRFNTGHWHRARYSWL